MTMEIKSYTIPATGLVQLEPANSFFILAVSGTVEIQLNTYGAPERLGNFASGISVPGGMRVSRVKGWKALVMLGASGTTITVFYGNQNVREDLTDVLLASTTGALNTSPGPGSAVNGANHADVTVAATTLDNTITANASRKFLIVGSYSRNAPTTPLNLRLQAGAGVAAAEGIELQPGTSYMLAVAAQMSIYNPDASAQKYWWIEIL